MSYFNKFPRLSYPVGDKEVIMKNIFIRASIANGIKDTKALYFEYDVTDGDTPEIVAHKVYGDAGLHWLVMMMNDSQNLYCDWVKSNTELEKFISDKYGEGNEYNTHHWEDSNGNVVNGPDKDIGNGYIIFNGYTQPTQDATPLNNVLWTSSQPPIYGGLFIESVVLDTGTRIESVEQDENDPTLLKITLNKDWNQQGSATFYVLSAIDASPVTNAEFEERENERKRRIKLLREEYVSLARRDLERLIEGIK